MASKIQVIEFGPAPKRPRAKRESHLDFIRQLPCAICGYEHSTEAAHVRMSSIRFAKQQAGVGAKPDDCWTIPLCNMHHRQQHDIGERQFWSERRDPFVLALALWQATGDRMRALIILRNAR